MATSNQDALFADEYLSALVYDALLERGEAAKVSEITVEINNPRITFPIVRRALSESPRFILVDRLWDLSARYLDRTRPTERNLREVLEAAGKPLSVAELATELSGIYQRNSDVYLQLLGKLLQDRKNYFRTPSGNIGPTTWLPLVDSDDVRDILYDNQLTPAILDPYEEASQQAQWAPERYAAATHSLASALNNQPLPHRIAGVLAWLELREKYDPVAHLLASLEDSSLVWVYGRWITRTYADRLEAILEERGQTLATEEEEAPTPKLVPAQPEIVTDVVPTVTATPATPVEISSDAVVDDTEPVSVPSVLVAEPVQTPLQVREEDLQAIERIVVDRGAAVDAIELLALQYEVVGGDPSYRGDLETLTSALRSDDRFLYVGAGRFREPNSLPLFVYTIPESLSFPDVQFVSLDGEIMDEEIEDEGFVGTLRNDLLSPLAQDAGDDEGHYTGAESADASTVTLVLKSHHKEIGTFPLCQVPDGFFPADAPVIELVIRDSEGITHDVILNHELRMLFNLFGLYEQLEAESGAMFHLHRTARPYEFVFEVAEETDPQVYLDPARIEELMALREQAEESGDVATFDIACEVLAHHAKGLDFVQAMTEVNIVRRVRRRKLASVLSNYLCFVQKPGQNLWRYDSKKRDLGTDSSKRKYLKR